MAKTKYEKELEKLSLGPLVRMCDGARLDRSGTRDNLIARLVAWEKAQSEEPEPEVEPPPAPPEE